MRFVLNVQTDSFRERHGRRVNEEVKRLDRTLIADTRWLPRGVKNRAVYLEQAEIRGVVLRRFTEFRNFLGLGMYVRPGAQHIALSVFCVFLVSTRQKSGERDDPQKGRWTNIMPEWRT